MNFIDIEFCALQRNFIKVFIFFFGYNFHKIQQDAYLTFISPKTPSYLLTPYISMGLIGVAFVGFGPPAWGAKNTCIGPFGPWTPALSMGQEIHSIGHLPKGHIFTWALGFSNYGSQNGPETEVFIFILPLHRVLTKWHFSSSLKEKHSSSFEVWKKQHSSPFP